MYRALRNTASQRCRLRRRYGHGGSVSAPRQGLAHPSGRRVSRRTSWKHTTCSSRSRRSRSRRRRSRFTRATCAHGRGHLRRMGSQELRRAREARARALCAHRARSPGVTTAAAEPSPQRRSPPELPAQLAATGVLDAGRDAEASAAERNRRAVPGDCRRIQPVGDSYRRLGRMTDARKLMKERSRRIPRCPPHRNLAVLLDLYLAQPARALEPTSSTSNSRWSGPEATHGLPSCARMNGRNALPDRNHDALRLRKYVSCLTGLLGVTVVVALGSPVQGAEPEPPRPLSSDADSRKAVRCASWRPPMLSWIASGSTRPRSRQSRTPQGHEHRALESRGAAGGAPTGPWAASSRNCSHP